MSCIHLKRVRMVSRKTDLSGESYQNSSSSQYSVNGGDASVFSSQTADKTLRQPTDQVGNLQRFNLNHNYISRSRERKSEIRPFELSPAMEDSMTLRKLFSQAKLSEDSLPAKAFFNSDHLSSANEDMKVEDEDGNVSSVICVDDVNKALNCEHGPVDRKGVMSGSDSVDSSHMEGVKKELQGTGAVAMHLTAGGLKCLKDDEQVEIQDTIEVRESAMQASTREDSEELDILEHDVKVCDICGDAGREFLLAVCSRCSDGAEHTYCMREMLQKVPEGEWLCEECKFADETESRQGALLKSKSFSAWNSKTKIKLDEVFSQKQRGKEHTCTFTKDGADKAISKSMSFKANSGQSIPVDAKASKISCRQDSKGPKVVREGSMSGMILHKLDRTGSLRNVSTNSSSKLDRKVISCVVAAPVTSASSHRDLKPVQSDGRLTGSAKSVGWNAVKGASSSSDRITTPSGDQKSNCSFQRDDQPSCASRDVHGIRNGGLARPRDWTNYLEKTRENPLGRSRQSMSNVSKSNFCQKCRELGHECESCTFSSSFGQAAEAPPSRVLREDTHHSDKFKATITSDMLKKPGIYRRNKGTEKSGDSSILSTDIKSVDLPSLQPREADGPHEGPATLSSSCSPPLMVNVINSSQVKVSSTEVGSSKDLPCMLASVAPQPFQVFAIPEYDYKWKGKFEVYRGNMIAEVLGGVQAHVSTWASPKVLDIVKLIPSKIHLNEVSRRSAWPAQFHECGAKDGNIALYFFADDLESYERSYKCLVEKMIKSDLALKGNFDGVELRIFASNQLPERSQRWNMLFYLWGVVRSRSVDGFDHESGSSQKSSISASNLVCLDEYEPYAVQPMSSELSLPKCNGGSLSSYGKSCNINLPSSSPSLAGLPFKSSCGATTGNDSVKSQYTDRMCLDPPAVFRQRTRKHQL